MGICNSDARLLQAKLIITSQLQDADISEARNSMCECRMLKRTQAVVDGADLVDLVRSNAGALSAG